MKNQFYLIPIIAILAGMLLPALNAARQSAKRTQCVNNLKQVAYIVRLYADDFGDWIPGNIITPSTSALATYKTHGYVKNPNTFVCPSFAPYKYMYNSTTYGTGSHQNPVNTKLFFVKYMLTRHRLCRRYPRDFIMQIPLQVAGRYGRFRISF